MGDQFKLETDGTCPSCNELSNVGENLKCCMCNSIIHGLCPNMNEDDKVGTKSLINAFLRPTTRDNFRFFCDGCLTKFETYKTNDESTRLGIVENNITSIKD